MTEPFWHDDHLTLWGGDCRDVLRELPAESVHMVCTSPPYWSLRDYGVEGQLGLEPTPEEFVANMVAVFREVRRVLRKDGTLWLNLGDSYVSTPSGSKGDTTGFRNGKSYEANFRGIDVGLKPKDLVGIPWRVARALQEPYYTGSIRDERDRIWLAAMVDGEGCIHIHRRAAGQSAHSSYVRKDGTTSNYVRTQDTFGVMVSVDNTSLALVDRAQQIAGGIGSRYVQEAGAGKANRKQTIYRWTVTGQQARDLIRELYPHLVAKQHQARIAYSSPSSGTGAPEAQEAVKRLHNGLPVTLDYPEPPTLFEPGWYLRAEIIWGKPNPMPESVTDRPTKAHEQIFLLTKSPRYYYDADAVREPPLASSVARAEAATRQVGMRREQPKKNGRADWDADALHFDAYELNPAGRNLRSVWTIATEPYPGAHFATFPRKLVEPCVKAGTSERGACPECGAPWVRVVERELVKTNGNAGPTSKVDPLAVGNRTMRDTWNGGVYGHYETETTGWRASCAHDAEPVPAVVLDPFAGSGTTLLVAQALGRRGIGIDLSPDYLKQALARNAQTPLGLVG